MRVPYRYAVRTICDAASLELELANLSKDGWEPVNFERDASGAYEVVLRQEEEEHNQVVLEHLEASVTDITTPPIPSQDLLQEAKGKART